MTGITLDTGALIALERRDRRMVAILRNSHERHITITVPTCALGEWWRSRTDLRERILSSVTVEPLDAALAKTAGEALAVLAGAGFVDVAVMASAARRGDVVYTSDVDELERLRSHFRAVARVLRAT